MTAPRPVSPATQRRVIDWLLEPEQPSMRYLTLTQLLGRPPGDPEVEAARQEIPRMGWAAEILKTRLPGGAWVDAKNLYWPKYHATTWQMIVLADLGLTREDPLVAESAELWMTRFALKGGGVGGNSNGNGHHCLVGNMARSLLQMGYVDDPRLPGSFDWLLRTASPLGGWSCFGSGRNLDSWEGLSAFAAYPRDRWSGGMRECVAKAVEFFLQRELHVQGGSYAPWYRFHYPVHYYYDLLVGLDVLTSLGCTDDPRLGHAIRVLYNRRRDDGRWDLDAVHPDVEGSIAAFFEAHPKERPTPLTLETPGRPSKMVTFRALRVLKRLGSDVSGAKPPRSS